MKGVVVMNTYKQPDRKMEAVNIICEGGDFPALTVTSGYGLNYVMSDLCGKAVLDFIGKYDPELKVKLISSDKIGNIPFGELTGEIVELALEEEHSMKFCEFLWNILTDSLPADFGSVDYADDKWNTFYILFAPWNLTVLSIEKIAEFLKAIFVDSGMYKGSEEKFKRELDYFNVISLGCEF